MKQMACAPVATIRSRPPPLFPMMPPATRLLPPSLPTDPETSTPLQQPCIDAPLRSVGGVPSSSAALTASSLSTYTYKQNQDWRPNCNTPDLLPAQCICFLWALNTYPQASQRIAGPGIYELRAPMYLHRIPESSITTSALAYKIFRTYCRTWKFKLRAPTYSPHPNPTPSPPAQNSPNVA